jgi:type IV pilus assembly protein PilQ
MRAPPPADTPIRQVMIEARIVIASDTFSKQLGVRFGAQTGFTFRNYAGGRAAARRRNRSHLQGDQTSATRARRRCSSSPPASRAPATGSPQLNVNLPVINPAGQLALTLINLAAAT